MIRVTKRHRSLKSNLTYKWIVRLMKGHPVICTTITANNACEFVNMTAAATKLGTDMAELRIDYLKNHDLQDIKKIISESRLPLIATLRSKDEGGMFPGNEKKRISLLYEIMEYKPAFIDIELSINEKQRTELIAIAHDKGVGVICSYHDFKNTPSSREIVNIFKKVSRTGADVVKLVFTPHTTKDVSNILDSVRLARSADIPSAIFGMGKAGQPTRILSPILGSCLTYCAVKVSSASNLAQISVKDTRSIFDMLLLKKKSWAAIRREPESLTSDISRFMSKLYD